MSHSIDIKNLNIDDVKMQLAKFNISELENDLAYINNYCDLSKSEKLVPQDFYNINNDNYSSYKLENFDAFKEQLLNLIKKLSNDIDKISSLEENKSSIMVGSIVGVGGLMGITGKNINSTINNTDNNIGNINDNDITTDTRDISNTSDINTNEENDIQNGANLNGEDIDDGSNIENSLNLQGINLEQQNTNNVGNNNENSNYEKNNISLSNEENSNNNKINVIDVDSNVLNVDEDFKLIVDGNIINIKKEKYVIVDYKYDVNKNLVSIAIIVDGVKIWIPVIDGKMVIPSNVETNVFNLEETITIVINNERINILKGNYQIIEYMYNKNGTVKAICIKYDKYKIWLYLENDKIIKVEYQKNEHGVFTITSPSFNIYDKYGNNLGKFKEGKYYIYEVRYDEFGKVIALRLSKEGDYELWLYINDDIDNANYSLFTEEINTNDNTTLSLFDDKKMMFGLLGILFVGLGTSLIVKKKRKKDMPGDEEYSEELLNPGNYAVYDLKKNDDGLITDARITPIDSEDEYWVEV